MSRKDRPIVAASSIKPIGHIANKAIEKVVRDYLRENLRVTVSYGGVEEASLRVQIFLKDGTPICDDETTL